ncbi:MAG: tyrosine-type recombinase/integrase [archaeon]
MNENVQRLDIHNYSERFISDFNHIKEMPEEQKKPIIEYHERYALKKRLTIPRQLKILNTLKLITQRCGKPISELNSHDIEQLEISLAKEGKRASTIQDYDIVIKQFFKFWDNEKGARWEWIKKNVRTGLKSKELKNYSPDDFMTIEERTAFLNSAISPIDRAFVSLLLSSGCRIGEIGNMKIKDIDFSEDGSAILSVNGKTGFRELKLFEPTTIYLKNYLEIHPLKHEPEAPVWLSYQGKQMTYNALRDKLLRIGKRAGIKRWINPHSFRHMRYTDFQLKGVPQAIIELHFGHAHGSKMSQRYTHAKFSQAHEYMDSIYGKVKKKEKKTEIEMIYCSKCFKAFPPTSAFCDVCQISLDKPKMDLARELESNKMLNFT